MYALEDDIWSQKGLFTFYREQAELEDIDQRKLAIPERQQAKKVAGREKKKKQQKKKTQSKKKLSYSKHNKAQSQQMQQKDEKINVELKAEQQKQKSILSSNINLPLQSVEMTLSEENNQDRQQSDKKISAKKRKIKLNCRHQKSKNKSNLSAEHMMPTLQPKKHHHTTQKLQCTLLNEGEVRKHKLIPMRQGNQNSIRKILNTEPNLQKIHFKIKEKKQYPPIIAAVNRQRQNWEKSLKRQRTLLQKGQDKANSKISQGLRSLMNRIQGIGFTFSPSQTSKPSQFPEFYEALKKSLKNKEQTRKCQFFKKTPYKNLSKKNMFCSPNQQQLTDIVSKLVQSYQVQFQKPKPNNSIVDHAKGMVPRYQSEMFKKRMQAPKNICTQKSIHLMETKKLSNNAYS